jgi:hypothetical protein
MNNFFKGTARLLAVFFLFLILSNSGLFAQALNEGFNSVTFPPTGWTQTAGLWSRNVVSGFCSGQGSAKADFYNVGSGTYDLTSPTFTPTGASDSLIFQDAYASYTGEDDQLQVMYSTNGGTTYTQLVLLHGGAAGALVTAPPQTGVFTPSCAQWKYQRFALPTGTNKLRFNGISAFGNNLYIDSIYVWNLPPPPVPTLLTPPNHSVGNVPSNLAFTWSASAGATSYRYQLATDSLFTVIVINQTFPTPNVNVSGFPPLSTWWWRVAAIGAGGQSAFQIPFTFKIMGPPTLITPLVPANNAVNQPLALTCVWSKSHDQTLNKPGGLTITSSTSSQTIGQTMNKGIPPNSDLLTISNYWYELYTDTTTSPIVRDSTLTDTTRALSGLTNSTNYWWRVKAKNQFGWGAFSVYFKFTTVIAPPAAPNLISPPNNALGIIPTPMLVWSNAATATTYRVQVSTDSTFGTTQFDTTTTTSLDSIQVPSGRLSNNVKYFWHVRGINIGGNGPYSTIFNFTTSLVGVLHNSNGIPLVFKLYHNYPNPFNPASTIKFDVPIASDVKMIVYNTLGQEVSTLVNAHLGAGAYSVSWDASNFPSGVYFYKITAGNFTDIQKMVLVK